MNYELLIVGGIFLIVGFSIGTFIRKKNNFVSSLAEFIIFGKQQNKSDELINKVIKNLTDLMLKGYENFTNDPKAVNVLLQREKKNLKDQKALIKAMQKTINKANKIIQEFSGKSTKE